MLGSCTQACSLNSGEGCRTQSRGRGSGGWRKKRKEITANGEKEGRRAGGTEETEEGPGMIQKQVKGRERGRVSLGVPKSEGEKQQLGRGGD